MCVCTCIYVYVSVFRVCLLTIITTSCHALSGLHSQIQVIDDSLSLPCLTQERKQAEEERLRKEKEMDYLAPYLARLGEPEQLSLHNKQQLREDCLRDLRVQLVDLANIIQARFEEVGTLSDVQTYVYTYICLFVRTYVHMYKQNML